MMTKFILTLFLIGLTVLVHLLNLEDLSLFLSGDPDWFVKVNLTVGLFPLSELLVLLLAIVWLITLLGLLWQLVRRQRTQPLRLRSFSVVVTGLSLLFCLAIRYAHDSAWSTYLRELEQALADLRPGQTPEQAEARLKRIHERKPVKTQLDGESPIFQTYLKNRSLGNLDAYETRVVHLNYSPEGRLQSWEYRRSVFVDQPLECQVLGAMPSEPGQTYPHPCSDDPG